MVAGVIKLRHSNLRLLVVTPEGENRCWRIHRTQQHSFDSKTPLPFRELSAIFTLMTNGHLYMIPSILVLVNHSASENNQTRCHPTRQALSTAPAGPSLVESARPTFISRVRVFIPAYPGKRDPSSRTSVCLGTAVRDTQSQPLCASREPPPVVCICCGSFLKLSCSTYANSLPAFLTGLCE